MKELTNRNDKKGIKNCTVSAAELVKKVTAEINKIDNKINGLQDTVKGLQNTKILLTKFLGKPRKSVENKTRNAGSTQANSETENAETN